MPRKQKKYHYLYKTTNLINDKFYVGMHSTDNLNDGYLGSGKRLKYSISKYGVENFKIEYLEFFEDRKTLVEREKNLVNEDFIKNPMCMNLKPGGFGGLNNKEHVKKFTLAGGNSTKHKWETDILFQCNWKTKYHNMYSNLMKSKLRNGKIKPPNWTGKKHSEETKSLMSEKAKLHIGNKNSQFGTCWITNNIDNKKIKKEELETWLKLGWFKGRIKKN